MSTDSTSDDASRIVGFMPATPGWRVAYAHARSEEPNYHIEDIPGWLISEWLAVLGTGRLAAADHRERFVKAAVCTPDGDALSELDSHPYALGPFGPSATIDEIEAAVKQWHLQTDT